MKTQFSLAPLALACSLLLTACNGSGDANTNSNASVNAPSNVQVTQQSKEAKLNLLADDLADLTTEQADISDDFTYAYQQSDEQTPERMVAFVSKFKVLMGDASGTSETGLFSGGDGASELVALLGKGLESEQSMAKYSKLIQLFDVLSGENGQGEIASFADILQGFSGDASEQGQQFNVFFAHIGGIADIKGKLLDNFSAAFAGQGEPAFELDAQLLVREILAQFMAQDESGENAEKIAKLTAIFEQYQALKELPQNDEEVDMAAVIALFSDIIGEGEQSILLTQILAGLTAISDSQAEVDWDALTEQILAQLATNDEFDTEKLTRIIDMINALSAGDGSFVDFDLAALFAGDDFDKELMLNGIITQFLDGQNLDPEVSDSIATMLTELIIKLQNGEEIEFSGEQLIALFSQLSGAEDGELPTFELGGIDLSELLAGGELDHEALINKLMTMLLASQGLDPEMSATMIASLEPIFAKLLAAGQDPSGAQLPPLQDFLTLFRAQS